MLLYSALYSLSFKLSLFSWSSFTQNSSSVCFSEDSSCRFGSWPAVLWPQYSWHNGYERGRFSGPGGRLPWCCCPPLVSITLIYWYCGQKNKSVMLSVSHLRCLYPLTGHAVLFGYIPVSGLSPVKSTSLWRTVREVAKTWPVCQPLYVSTSLPGQPFRRRRKLVSQSK